MNSHIVSALFLSCASALVLTGCSSVINSHRQKVSMMEAFEEGNHGVVMNEIGYKLREPAFYNSSVVNSGDEVMWRLEAGSMNFYTGNFAESVAQFKQAEALIAGYDDRAKISLRDGGEELGSSFTNMNILPYRGFCRDRIALSIYKSLAYLGMNDESAFRAQLRRLRKEQKKVQEDYQAFFESENAEVKAAREANPEAAEKADKAAASEEQLENDPQNEEFSAAMKEVRKIAHKGYGGFLNPAAIYLSGLGSLRDESYDNARIDFKRLYEAMPQNVEFQRYYVTVLHLAGRRIPRELKHVKPFDFPLDRDCVYVLFANGRGAAFRQIAVYFPFMTAWPMCEFYPAPFDEISVEADGVKHSSVILADMDGILAQEFQERLPGMITRIVLSTLIKEGAYYGGLVAIWNADMNPVAKFFVLCAVAVGGAGYRVAMNTADTRSWETLPKEFHLTQFPMPENRKLKIYSGKGELLNTVEIPPEAKSAVVFVSAPGPQNSRAFVLPMRMR